MIIMKKLWMLAIAGLFFFASCGNKPAEVTTEPEAEVKTDATECQSACKELTEEQKAEIAAWEDWANQTPEKKEELVAKRKECIDKKMSECCGEKKEECPEQAAKCAEFKAKWDNWNNLDIEAKKALIDEKMSCCKKKCEGKGGEGCCKKAE